MGFGFGVKKKGAKWGKWKKTGKSGLKGIMRDSGDRALESTGKFLLDQFKRNITARGTLVRAPFIDNAPLTIKLKGHNKPLIGKTRKMFGAIRLKKMKKNKWHVGWDAGIEAAKARFLENGGITTINGRPVFVPARPHVLPFVTHPGMRKTAQSKFQAAMMNGIRGSGL